MWAFPANRVRAGEASYQPGIKFLDDLTYGFRPPGERNPYEERIETERHDFTQSTVTLGRGVIQVESGYTYLYKDRAEEIEQSHTFPEMLWRFGLSEDIEFRFRWTYGWRFIDEAEDLYGGQDLIWSFKLGMTDQYGWIPESALEIRSSVPTGARVWSLDRVEAGFDYIYAWELSEGVELYGSTGFLPGGLGEFSLIPEEPASDRFNVASQSIALGFELADDVTIYSEWFGLWSHALEDDFAINFYNVGVDYYVSDDFVLDVRFAVGLTNDSDDFFSGVGGGYRF